MQPLRRIDEPSLDPNGRLEKLRMVELCSLQHLGYLALQLTGFSRPITSESPASVIELVEIWKPRDNAVGAAHQHQ